MGSPRPRSPWSPRRGPRSRRRCSSACSCRLRSLPEERGSRPRRARVPTSSLASSVTEALGDAGQAQGGDGRIRPRLYRLRVVSVSAHVDGAGRRRYLLFPVTGSSVPSMIAACASSICVLTSSGELVLVVVERREQHALVLQVRRRTRPMPQLLGARGADLVRRPRVEHRCPVGHEARDHRAPAPARTGRTTRRSIGTFFSLRRLHRAQARAVAVGVEHVRALRDLREAGFLALQRILEVADPGHERPWCPG